MSHVSLRIMALACFGWLGCIEGGDLAVSAGAPVTGAVRGTVMVCGVPLPNADVVLHVEQSLSGQVRPVDTQVGPVTTDHGGGYAVEVGPAFAVPGPATVTILVAVAGAPERELPGATLHLSLGEPPRDTLRLDADLGLAAGSCR